MNTPRLATIFLLLLPYTLCAQQASPQPTPLSEPLLQMRAPDFASWTITRSAAGESGGTNAGKAAPTARGTKITVIKTGGLLLRSATDEKGQVWNTWCTGKTQVTIYPNQKDSVVQDSAPQGTSLFYTDYSKSDFPDFAWVTQGSYAGTKAYGGHACLIFHGHRDVESWAVNPVAKDKSGEEAAFDPSAMYAVTVYIDAESRLPVAIQDGPTVQVITFSPAPTEVLKFPALVNDILNQRAANWRALGRTIHAQS